jgi:hypothetical protein
MKPIYTLAPNGLEYQINKYFPPLEEGKKMGVFLSGGMESTLISLIAQEVYGKNRVFNFYSDNIFSANDPNRSHYIRGNVQRSADFIGVESVYLDFDYQLHVADRQQSIENKMLSLRETYNVDFVMFGFTKLFFEVEPFKQEGLTEKQVREIAFADPTKFKSTIEEFHLETDEYTWHLLDIDIPSEVYHLLRQTSGFIRSPFKDLNKCEVVDLYTQLNKLDVLYRTSSCITDSLTRVGKHCGRCFNCQQRWDSFKIAGTGIKDQTVYESNEIVHRRDRLARLRNA